MTMCISFLLSVCPPAPAGRGTADSTGKSAGLQQFQRNAVPGGQIREVLLNGGADVDTLPLRLPGQMELDLPGDHDLPEARCRGGGLQRSQKR